jgi:hypothetical protein
MSNTILCRECNTANTPGSKFCNNCGARLPPSTNLLCPNCGTPNPRNRFYCDNCGTRLVRDERPVEPESKGDEPPTTGVKVFSLPARKPGDTSDLDPSTLPDWLKTGERQAIDASGAGEEVTEDQVQEPPAEEGPANKGKLPKLAELAPSRKTTDDLPDWLVDSENEIPIIQAPREITTEHFFDLLHAEEGAGEGEGEVGGDPAAEANLPDWLTDLSQPGSAGPISWPANKDRAPDWLATPSPGAADEPDVVGEPIIEADVPDWLADLSQPAGPVAIGEESTSEAESASAADWLADLTPPTELEPPGTDILSEPVAATTRPPSVAESLSDWLADLDSPTEPGPPDTDIVSEPADAMIDQTEEELPSWLAGISDEDAAITLSDSDTSDVPDDLFTADQVDNELSFDWLTGSGPLPYMAGDEEAPGVAQAAEAREAADESSLAEDPDWLTAFAAMGADTFTASEQTDEPEAVEELTFLDEMWLTGSSDLVNEEQVEAGSVAHDATSEWADVDVILGDELVEEELPDWIAQLGAPVSGQPPGETEQADMLIPSDSLPEWIASMKPSSSFNLASSLPNAFSSSPTPSMRETLQDMPEELSGGELPEWLQDISPVASASETAVAPSAATPDVPEWLKTEGGLEEWGESGSSTPIKPGELTPAASAEWGALLSDLPPSLPLEQTLAKADIPEWVQALKPRELTGEPEAEIPALLQTTGPLVGLRNVVDVEPVIAMPRAASPIAHFTVTQEQQQQVALLRQLAHEEQIQAAAVTSRITGAMSPWIRLLLTLLLLAAILFGLRGPDLLRRSAPSVTPAVQAASAAVTAAAGRAVLVAFEYTPAMAGELDPQADILLAQLMTNESTIITVSQFAAGTAVAAANTADVAGQSLGFLPGEAIGLRQLGNCLRDRACETIAGRQVNTTLQQALSDVGLIIVLTGDRSSLINWIEQVGVISRVPLLAGVTQSLGPVAAPYVASGQLQGVIEGIPAVAVYQQAFQAGVTQSVRQQLNAQGMAQLLAAALLLIGGLAYGIAGAINKPSQKQIQS